MPFAAFGNPSLYYQTLHARHLNLTFDLEATLFIQYSHFKRALQSEKIALHYTHHVSMQGLT